MRNSYALVFVAALVFPSPIVSAQTYTEREFVAGGGTAIIDTSKQVPLPFAVPKPGRSNRDQYRLLDVLNKILLDPGTAEIVDAVNVGPAQLSTSATATGRQVVAVTITSRTGPSTVSRSIAGPIDPFRPDGSQKGRAVLVAGAHSNEWMAIEGLVRRLEPFQSKEFATRLRSLATAPGSRDVYFAENLEIVLVPVLNPGGLDVTQDAKNYKKCFMIDTAATGDAGAYAPGLQMGRLRDGRMRRKNLLGTDGVLGANSSTDTDALFGVDINRNLTDSSDDIGLTDSRSLTFRGWGSGAARIPCPEATALKTVTDSAFRRPDLTGAAFLDVHTAMNEVSYSAIGTPAAGPDRFLGFANAVRAAASYSKPIDADAKSMGTSDYFVRSTYGVPAVTFELPRDSNIVANYGTETTSAAVPNRLGVSLLAPTQFDMGFFVGPDDFQKQAALVANAADATLDWATGPPYVTQVLLLQDKNGDGAFDLTSVGADAEVI